MGKIVCGSNSQVVVGNGDQTLFWLDKWVGSSTLASMFPSLFSLSSSPSAFISSLRFKENSIWRWEIHFRIQLTGDLVFQYFNMLNIINSVSFNDYEDKREWLWEANKFFSVKSFYHFLIDGGLRFDCSNLWELTIPLKVKFVVWLALRNGLNTTDILAKKGIILQRTCCLCTKSDEDHSHLFLKCEFVYSIWRSLQFKLNTDKDFSLSSVKEVWIQWTSGYKGDSNLKRRVFICSLIWCLWQERNDRIFSDKKKSSLTLLNKIVTFSTFWLGSEGISARAARLQARRRKRAAAAKGVDFGSKDTATVIQLE
ncbi:uncharacterized protein LOC109838548 [Asparagus officinalis]|uniref:uncharacterized protein LOC109838548 n=1 Tax=Asparagus officinalis TaxID=4686 RepID=UPI00098E3056|nr:uncharacterized protein LOC109838548 [Asparagus officinalis]